MAAITTAQSAMYRRMLYPARKLMTSIPGMSLMLTNFDATTGALVASINDPNLEGVANPTFRVNTGAATPEIIIGGGSATGDYAISLISPTLAADRVITFPAVTSTLASLTGAETLTNKTLTSPVIGTGLTASGSAANDFSGSTGTFETSSGANTLSGDVTIAAGKDLTMSSTATISTGTGAHAFNGDITVAADKDISLAKGSGYIEINADTSGILKILPVAATAQTVTLTTTAQTSGAGSIAIPDLAGGALTMAVTGADNAFSVVQAITSDDTTDGVVDLLTLTHSSSDNHATVGDGVGISFELENVSTTHGVEEWASFDVISAVITDGAEDADIELKAMLAGTLAPVLTMDASDETWVIGANATSANGLNGLRIMPQTASAGSLVIRATANTSGDDEMSITNADMAQAVALTIPDPGNATASFLLTYGAATVNGVLTHAAYTIMQDGQLALFGTGSDAGLAWDTADANAECLHILLGDPAGNVVPVALFGAQTATSGVDHTFFNGITQPTIALLDADADSWMTLSFGSTDEATIATGGAAAAAVLSLPRKTGRINSMAGTATTSAGDSLAIPLTHGICAKTTGGDAEALTLANGEEGQELMIYLAVDGGGTGTLTPATATGFATIAFADAGDQAVLRYVDDTIGWIILSVTGPTQPPVVAIT